MFLLSVFLCDRFDIPVEVRGDLGQGLLSFYPKDEGQLCGSLYLSVGSGNQTQVFRLVWQVHALTHRVVMEGVIF